MDLAKFTDDNWNFCIGSERDSLLISLSELIILIKYYDSY